MPLDRDNLMFQLNANQSYHRLPEKTQAILANKILGVLRKIQEGRGEDFLLSFRMRIDRKLATVDFEKKAGPFGLWKVIEREAMSEVMREFGLKTQVEMVVDDFISKSEGLFA